MTWMTSLRLPGRYWFRLPTKDRGFERAFMVSSSARTAASSARNAWVNVGILSNIQSTWFVTQRAQSQDVGEVAFLSEKSLGQNRQDSNEIPEIGELDLDRRQTILINSLLQQLPEKVATAEVATWLSDILKFSVMIVNGGWEEAKRRLTSGTCLKRRFHFTLERVCFNWQDWRYRIPLDGLQQLGYKCNTWLNKWNWDCTTGFVENIQNCWRSCQWLC